MAKTLKTYHFSKNGGASRYPWHEWLDGRIWELKRGTDFMVDPRDFRTAAYHAARSRDGKAQVSVRGDDTAIIQFTKNGKA